MITVQDILQAQQTIQSFIFHTPLRESFLLNERIGAQVFLKLENWQITGSFKPRGALNRMARMTAEERARGIVTASAGNHALGVGYAAQVMHIAPAMIFVPRTAPRTKLDKLRQFPVDVRAVGETYDDAHHTAEAYARETNATFIHAYDDPHTVAGQGTLGLEIIADVPNVDAILVPVGGGGLIAGIAVAVKTNMPNVQVIGVQPAASPALRDSLRDGKCYEEYAAAPTICDGLAGGIGKTVFEVANRHVASLNAISSDSAPRDDSRAQNKLIDAVVLVEESETRAAIRTLVEMQQLVVEGSGAVGVAALLFDKVNLKDKRVAVVLSGGNIDMQLLSQSINHKL